MFTFLRDTLNYVKHRNVTLSLPEPLLRMLRMEAASRDQSMSALMVEALRSLTGDSEQAGQAKHRFLERIRSAPDRGTGGANR